MSFLPICNPTTGEFVFGHLPQLRLAGIFVDVAPVLLFEGRHAGPNRGFGLEHIWIEHRQELERLGFSGRPGVPSFVATVVRERTPLYFEGGNFRSTRVLAVRSKVGTAILEYRQRTEGPIWSVVTAFAGTKAHGTLVGTVR